jgi:hybrid cluster-associated redox disulfide protein
MSDQTISADVSVEETMQRWPVTIAVFQRHKMACVGCAVAPFFSVGKAATIYGIPVDQFVTELAAAVSAETPASS